MSRPPAKPSVPIAAQLRYLLRRAGWPALAGLALFAGALAMHYAYVEPAEQQISELRSKIAKARRLPPVVNTTATDADSVLAALPARDTLEHALGAIHQAAAADGLSTAVAEYRARQEGEFTRYEIALPVRAAWTPLRHWLAAVVDTQPALAVDELSLHRDNAEGEPLAGRVQLTLYLRRAAAADPPGESTLPERSELAASAVDAPQLFAARSWQPPPPPPPPPPAPTAPPLPFKFSGRLIAEDGLKIFVNQSNKTILVKQGDHLGNYDVERIDKTSAVFVYRPLQEKQTMIFGGDD